MSFFSFSIFYFCEKLPILIKPYIKNSYIKNCLVCIYIYILDDGGGLKPPTPYKNCVFLFLGQIWSISRPGTHPKPIFRVQISSPQSPRPTYRKKHRYIFAHVGKCRRQIQNQREISVRTYFSKVQNSPRKIKLFQRDPN